MPADRNAITRKFDIPYVDEMQVVRVFDMYVTVGLFADGSPGEIMLKTGKSGDLVRGCLDVIGLSFSLALQHGVPLETLVSKLRHMRCGPSGFTGIPDFPSCTSPFDLLAQWLDKRFCAKPDTNADVRQESQAG